MNIEVEIRSFISEEKYEELMRYFHRNARFIKKDYQETYYFDTTEDLRIQKNDYHSKIWMKKGQLHDHHREEIEIPFEKEKFEDLEKIFTSLGHNIEIKWFRKRYKFDWNGITVCLDNTKGYGYIIELEKMSNNNEKERVYEHLKKELEKLGVKITPREIFEEKFNNYKNNWKELTK